MIGKLCAGVVTLTALSVGSQTMAEPQNPNLGTFKQTGYVRAAMDPRDRKVANLPPSAAAWNGSAFWQALTYCGSMHGAQGLRVKASGQAAVDEQDALAKHYMGLAIGALQKDRGVDAKAAQAIIEPEDAYWSFSFAEQPLNYPMQAMLCRLVESRSKS